MSINVWTDPMQHAECTCEGEQRFFEDYKKLASFREDPVIATAVERIHEKLGQDAPCQEMQMGGM